MEMTLKELVMPYLWKYLTVFKDELCKCRWLCLLASSYPFRF